jgi:hypothetical protein
MFTRFEERAGGPVQRFHQLPLERSSDILHHPHGDEALTPDVSRLDSIEPVA